MLIGGHGVSVWLVAEPTDMRKSIDGLAQLVVDSLDRQPVSGEVFAFSNRDRDKVKLIWYDHNGFWLAYKRLERSRFRWPKVGGSMQWRDLHLLLEGVDLRTPRFRPVHVERVN